MKKIFILFLMLSSGLFLMGLQDNSRVGDRRLGMWHFNEGTGATTINRADTVSFGAISGAPWVTGRFGNCLYYTGNAGVTKVVASFKLVDTSHFSIAAWVYRDDDKQYQGIFSTNLDNEILFLLVDNTNKVGLYMDPANADWGIYANTAVPKNKWVHLAATYDATKEELVFYYNGRLDGTHVIDGVIETASASSQIGVNDPANNWGWCGYIDELIYWNRTVNTGEIQALYSEGRIR